MKTTQCCAKLTSLSFPCFEFEADQFNREVGWSWELRSMQPASCTSCLRSNSTVRMWCTTLLWSHSTFGQKGATAHQVATRQSMAYYHGVPHHAQSYSRLVLSLIWLATQTVVSLPDDVRMPPFHFELCPHFWPECEWSPRSPEFMDSPKRMFSRKQSEARLGYS